MALFDLFILVNGQFENLGFQKFKTVNEVLEYTNSDQCHGVSISLETVGQWMAE